MKLRVAYRIAVVLVLSLLRSSRKSTKVSRGFFSRPVFLVVVDAVIFVVVTLAVLFFAPYIGMRFELGALTSQVLVGLPPIIFLMILIYSILWEISTSAQSTSSDVVNWLPVEPAEYVLGSTLSVVYYFSWFLAAIFAAALALTILTGGLGLWLLFLLLSLIAAFSGGFAVEIIRGATSKVSSSFYKRGGRSTIAIRLAVTIIVLTVFMTLTNVNLMYGLLQGIASGVNVVWFLPPVWPSLVIISVLQARSTEAFLFAASSLAFILLLFVAGLKLRERYWVPAQVSIKLGGGKYAPRAGFLNRVGFTVGEAALVRKDMRALTRRREMSGFIAIPIFITVIMGIPALSRLGEAEGVGATFNYLIFLIGPMLFALILALSSFGQEGESVWNICALPLRVGDIIKAKLGFVLLPTLIFLVAVWLLVAVLQPPTETFLLLLAGGLLPLPALTLMGLAAGARYPDFRVLPRSRFIGLKGTLLGFALGGAVTLAILTPLAAHLIIAWEAFNLPSAIMAAVAVAVAVTAVAYFYARANIVKLFQQHIT